MNLKKLLSVLLCVAMLLSLTAGLAGCGNDTAEENGAEEAVLGDVVKHSISVKSIGGMALEGVEVYVYADETKSDMKGFAETDAEGNASVELAKGGNYAIVLSGTPKGYQVEDTYSFNGTAADITLTSALVPDENLSGATLGLGDVMYDFSTVDAQGNTVTLSELLKDKDMVLINFFYTTCGPCVNEFPYMQEAYEMYQEDVAIIALDPLDDSGTVAGFQGSMGLTFPMASVQAAWSQTFGITGYPTSIVVDRYGVICLVEVGGITSLRPFTSIFEHFTGDDYEQKICYGGANDVITVMKPTYEMPASEEIAAAIQSGELPITYRAEEGESGEYTWPFIVAEKNGESCIKASNQGIEGSYAILYADVELKAGQAVAFDYLVSCENTNDAMVVIVDNEDIFQMSGYDEEEIWKSCYPWVAEADGTYEVALCYLKDEADNAGDDTVYEAR